MRTDPKGGTRARQFQNLVNAATLAAGLRVPKAYADYIILDILKKSDGTAVTATDEEMLAAVRAWASQEGIFAAPEGPMIRRMAMRDFESSDRGLFLRSDHSHIVIRRPDKQHRACRDSAANSSGATASGPSGAAKIPSWDAHARTAAASLRL